MFSEILNVWKEEKFLGKVISDFKDMLDNSQFIFDKATKVWWGSLSRKVVHADIYARDRKINENEQSIRRRLVEHLAINPRKDFPACLVFMSVTKDVERVGDYCKNIFELRNLLKSPLEDNTAEVLRTIEAKIESNLLEISSAFLEADIKKASSLMQSHGKIASECEGVIRSMLEEDLSVDKAVSYTLLVRYYKRISAHIANIASSVVNPLEKIDYVVEGLL